MPSLLTKGILFFTNRLQKVKHLVKLGRISNYEPFGFDMIWCFTFDKVRHDLLINKLQDAGFGGKLLDWLHAYPCELRQCVTVLGATSRHLPVTSSVPQGSILGPALFLLYANTLPDVITESQVVVFADDTKIYKEVMPWDDCAALQQDLHSLFS